MNWLLSKILCNVLIFSIINKNFFYEHYLINYGGICLNFMHKDSLLIRVKFFFLLFFFFFFDYLYILLMRQFASLLSIAVLKYALKLVPY